MTTTNNEIGETLAVAVNDISTMKEDIKEIKEILKAQPNTYVTRAELKVTQWVFGALMTALAIFLSLKDHLK